MWLGKRFLLGRIDEKVASGESIQKMDEVPDQQKEYLKLLWTYHLFGI